MKEKSLGCEGSVLYKLLHERLDDILSLEIRLAEMNMELGCARTELEALDGVSYRLDQLERVALATQKARTASNEPEYEQALKELDEALQEAGMYDLTEAQQAEIDRWRDHFVEYRAKIADLESRIDFWAERFRNVCDVLARVANDRNYGIPLDGHNAKEYQEWAREALKTYANGLVVA